MSKYKVCLEQYHDLAASLLQTGGSEGREDDFFMALERGDVEGVKCILSSIQPLDVKSWVNLKKGDETRDTPLIIAARRGYCELVKLLIQMGSDPTLTNAFNQTPLHVTKDTCRDFILKSAHRTPSKTTGLLASSWLGNKYTVEDILKRGHVDVNTRNLDYFTPLLLVTRDIQIFDKITLDDSVEYEPVQVAAELISYNTNVMKACDDIGRNAVHLAAGHTGPTAQKLIELLLDNCQEEELELKDSRANTPLHYATQSGDREIVASLIRRGANPNAVGERGYTPLHISATRGTVELAGFLLGNGADIRIVDDAGDSAYQLASTDGMKRKLKEAWTEATQLERTDSEITLTQSCLLEETGARASNEIEARIGRGGGVNILCYQLNPTNRINANDNPNDLSAFIDAPTAHKLATTRANRNGYTNDVLLAETGGREMPSDEEYEDLEGEYEEAMDQLRTLPNQLLASKPTRVSGNSLLNGQNNIQSSQDQLNTQRNQYANYVNNYSTKKKIRRNVKRKLIKPPTEDKLKALSMPKHQRGTKESSIPAVSDPVGVSQSKRCFGSTLQSDSVTGVTETETIMIRNKQPDTLKNNNNNNKLGCDTSSNNNATGKVKGIHFKTGKESKSSVFDRLHKTPIRNMKANAKSDINLLAQIHEEVSSGETESHIPLYPTTDNNQKGNTEVSNAAQETTKPVVVNFGGIKGLGIGGAVLLGNNKENNPLRFFLLDINQVPEKRRPLNDTVVNKPTNKQIPTKPTEPLKTINPTCLAVVAQKFSKPTQGLQLHLQTARKPTQSDSAVYNLKTPAEELALLELQRCSSQLETLLDGDSKEESPIDCQEDTHPPDTSSSPGSPVPDRPPTALGAAPSHISLPRVSQSPQLIRSRPNSFIENSITHPASLHKSNSQNIEDTFLPPISPGRSISNPEKHSSLRPRSKSSDCLTLSKSLTSINLRSSQGAELDIDESIFCRCTPQTHKPPSPSPPVDSPVSSRDRRADMNKYPSGEDDVDIIQQVMNSPKMKNISSPKPSLLRTPVRGASRQSIVQKPMVASMELDEVSPSRRNSFPFISLSRKDSPVDIVHKSIGTLSENEVPLCPSIPEIEREAVNSEEIVSVLGKSRSRLTNKSCLTPSLPSPVSHPISERTEADRDSEDSDEEEEADTTEVIRWKRGAVLGIGAYGTVVRGLTLDKGMIIAVKQIELNHYDREKALKQYELVKAEVDVLKSLTHVNIVKYLGSCLDNMTVNIFMEFVAGGSVAKLLKTFGPFEESFLCNYTRQIVTGVKYLHSKTVIHRDVKGDNIMVEPSGCIKLIDFGCARAFRDESSTLSYEKFTMLCKSMKGTVYWMAPEVIREEEYNEKADIWSIGCTVFEMATGKPPWAYKELSQEAALFRIGMGYDIPDLPETMSDGVKEFINRCLQQDPTKRPSSKQLLLLPFLKECF